MNREQLKTYVLGKKGSEETFPFGDQAAVFKVLGKMFALIPVDNPLSISLKCDPDFAEVLRDTYDAVTPGYHLNKRHWNTIMIDGSIPDDEIEEMVDNSYKLVVAKMTRKDQKRLQEL